MLGTQDQACLSNQSIHQKEIIFKVKSCLHDKQQNINPNRCVGGNGKSEPWNSRLLKANELKCQRRCIKIVKNGSLRKTLYQNKTVPCCITHPPRFESFKTSWLPIIIINLYVKYQALVLEKRGRMLRKSKRGQRRKGRKEKERRGENSERKGEEQ